MFSDPVVGDNFFGRQAIIDLIIKRARALKSGYRQNIAIIGHRQVGKTSLLRQFLHVYKDPDILSVYIEIKFQALDYFVDQFIRALLYQYLIQTQAVEPTESLTSLCSKAMPLIPKTVSRVEDLSKLLRHRHSEEAYSKLFELTTIVKEETGKNCIVILDEFHRLGEFGIRNAFSDFGKRIMVQKDTMYLLASSSFSASRRILAEKLSLLFGNFERIYLDHFTFETSFDFLEKKLAPLELNRNLKHFLVSFTDGHPFFLETIAGRIRELGLSKSETRVWAVTVSEALEKLLYESQGVFNQYFLKLISPWMQRHSKGRHVLVLTQLARGHNKLRDVSLALNRPQREISGYLKELMEHELIIKTGVFYRFHNKIFKFWLREVYEKKELSLLGTSGKAAEFRARIGKLIAENEELLSMDVSKHLIDLLGSFRNEIIEFGEKKRQLPHFTEIIPAGGLSSAPGTGFRKLVAKGRGRCWVCKIVEERATEKEVMDLVESDDRSPNASRVLVALRGMDDNAKLLAKEKKILTLGLGRINMLMDIYGKSPIIHA